MSCDYCHILTVWNCLERICTSHSIIYKMLQQFSTYLGQEVYKVKVKCTLVQAMGLSTGRTAHRESRGIALPFHDHGTRRGWGVSFTPRPLFTLGRDLVPIVQEAGCAPRPVWSGAENLALTGIRPRTVQPVASRYTDWATRPTKSIWW